MTERREMEAVVEAILFVANEPVARTKLLEVFTDSQRDEAEAALEAVLARYSEDPERGVLIDEAAGGLRLVSRPDLHGYLRRFFEVTGTNKLTMAALETLAIIAYRQPITSPEIQELRGIKSGGVLKTLLERRLIRIAGRKEVVGKPFLYATTREFLMRFGLRNLKELPPLEQFEELLGEGDEAALPGDLSADEEEQMEREPAEHAKAEEPAFDEAQADEAEAEREAAGAAADDGLEVSEEVLVEAEPIQVVEALPDAEEAPEPAGEAPPAAVEDLAADPMPEADPASGALVGSRQ